MAFHRTRLRRVIFKLQVTRSLSWTACLLGTLFSQGLMTAAYAGNCLTAECHAGMAAQSNAHQPVKEAGCEGCHAQKEKEHPGGPGAEFGLLAEGAELCRQCHDPYGNKKVVHAPVLEGECLTCHNPHGTGNRFLLEVAGDQRPLCYKCHDQAPFEQPHGHGPVDVGTCTVCHSPHESDFSRLLKKKSTDTCFECHDDFAEGLKKAAVVHSAVKDQSCTACHEVHGSPQPKLLRRENQDVCFECHQDIKDSYRRSRSKHATMYADARCGNCHLVHFADKAKLLLFEEKELCLKCHGKERKARSKDMRNIEEELEGKKFLHGPIAENKCVPCHDPHGSMYSKLTPGPFPGTFYAGYEPGVYDFCFGCHKSSMLKQRETDADTNFRNGNANLHYLHVVKDMKGRSCQACHATHASSGEKLISQEGVPFGNWNIPIRYTMSETGGSCMPGCHRELKYDRENAVDNRQNKQELPVGEPYVDYNP